MSPLAWVLLGVVVALLLGAWLFWTASRLDQMQHRLDVARESLRTQLALRSGAALELGSAGVLDPARSLLLVDAAHRARAATPDSFEEAESDLSETLRAVFADREETARMQADPRVSELLRELAGACRKVELARRFHNDHLTSVRALRSRRRVRWLRLAGRSSAPSTVDLDDEAPAVFAPD